MLTARPHLNAMRDALDETANLVVLEDAYAVYLEQARGSRAVPHFTEIGQRVPAHACAAGKAMLAAKETRRDDRPNPVPAILASLISDREVGPNTTDVVRALEAAAAKEEARTLVVSEDAGPDDGSGVRPLHLLTPRTLADDQALRADLELTRRRGYAIDDEEYEEGVGCVGAAVLGHDELPLAALSVSGPAARLRRRGIDDIGRRVAEHALSLSRELGYQRLRA